MLLKYLKNPHRFIKGLRFIKEPDCKGQGKSKKSQVERAKAKLKKSQGKSKKNQVKRKKIKEKIGENCFDKLILLIINHQSSIIQHPAQKQKAVSEILRLPFY